MSKFSIKVELQGLKIEVEGSREDAPRLAQRVGEQLGNLVQPALLIGDGKSTAVSSDQEARGSGEERTRKRRSSSGASGGRAPAEEIKLSVDPAKQGSPRQDWTTVQKSIWLLHVAERQLTANEIEKAFNSNFKAAGTIRRGNIGRDLEKERMRGKEATVGAEVNEGVATYFLTDSGKAMAERLASGGDAAKAAGAS